MAELRLCYAQENWAWFTSNLAATTGDDWNDAPHDCNAGPPYRDDGVELLKVAFDGDLELVGAHNFGNGTGRWGYLSVDQINEGAAPWLVQVLYGRPLAGELLQLGVQIPSGVTLTEFSALVEQADGTVYLAGAHA